MCAVLRFVNVICYDLLGAHVKGWAKNVRFMKEPPACHMKLLLSSSFKDASWWWLIFFLAVQGRDPD